MMVFPRPALALLAVLTATSGLDAQTTFKYRFKNGETLHYDLTIATKGSTRIGDTDMSGADTQNILMSWRVESVDAKGAAKIKVTFDRVKLSSENPKGSAEVVSDAKQDPDKEPAKSMMGTAKLLAKVAGTFTVAPQGQITDVNVLTSALKEMRALPGAEKVEEKWAQGNLEGVLKDAMLDLPTKALAKGQTWKTPVDNLSPFGKRTGEIVFTYVGKANRNGRALDKFEIRPKLKIEPDPNAKPPVTIKRYDSSATVYFDNDAGKLVEMSAVQTIEVQAEVMGKMFTQRTEVTNTMKLVK